MIQSQHQLFSDKFRFNTIYIFTTETSQPQRAIELKRCTVSRTILHDRPNHLRNFSVMEPRKIVVFFDLDPWSAFICNVWSRRQQKCGRVLELCCSSDRPAGFPERERIIDWAGSRPCSRTWTLSLCRPLKIKNGSSEVYFPWRRPARMGVSLAPGTANRTLRDTSHDDYCS